METPLLCWRRVRNSIFVRSLPIAQVSLLSVVVGCRPDKPALVGVLTKGTFDPNMATDSSAIAVSCLVGPQRLRHQSDTKAIHFRWFTVVIVAQLLSTAALSCALGSEVQSGPIKPDPLVFQPPKMTDAPGFSAEGVKAIFYDGLPYQGKPTRVFAWIGFPKTEPGTKVPGMVLVHGGGGTAFARWAQLWVSRGYAAIAMDNCGQLPIGKYNHWQQDEQGGPSSSVRFTQPIDPIGDAWSYHAATDVVLANSLLRSMPQVDADRIGLTGISWGGYLTCIVAGMDDRFKFAAPVYGCGFLGEDSVWRDNGEFNKMGPEKLARWLSLWDPSVYLPAAKMPMLWIDGTNDFAYPLDSLQKSYRLPTGPRTLCTKVRMPHGHPTGEAPEEVHAFADAILMGGRPLAKITDQGRGDRDVWATFDAAAKIAHADLNFTKDEGAWQKRKWETIAATLIPDEHKVTAKLPEGVRVYYLNLVDDRGLIVSTEHEELKLSGDAASPPIRTSP